jgi:hypothetical protein
MDEGGRFAGANSKERPRVEQLCPGKGTSRDDTRNTVQYRVLPWSIASNDVLDLAVAPRQSQRRHRANAFSAAAHLALMFLRIFQTGVNGVPIARA